MRLKYNKRNLRKINNEIILLGLFFILSLLIGTFLNKIWSSYNIKALDNLNQMINHYNNDILVFENILPNFKSDLIFMIGISISSFLFLTFPFSIILFRVKGISIGYTINTIIISLKLKSFKLFFITILKNIIIVPGIIILLIFSINHIKEVFLQIKSKRKDNISFLSKRYIINALLISFSICFIQGLVNILFILFIKLFN